jgi:hypothetical protein
MKATARSKRRCPRLGMEPVFRPIERRYKRQLAMPILCPAAPLFRGGYLRPTGSPHLKRRLKLGCVRALMLHFSHGTGREMHITGAHKLFWRETLRRVCERQ